MSNMNSSIVLAYVTIKLQTTSLKVTKVKFVHFVLETDLCVVVRSVTFGHTGGLWRAVKEINCQQGNELAPIAAFKVANSRDLREVLVVELSFFNFKIKDVLIWIHLCFIWCNWEFTLNFKIIKVLCACFMGFTWRGHPCLVFVKFCLSFIQNSLFFIGSASKLFKFGGCRFINELKPFNFSFIELIVFSLYVRLQS